MKINFFKKSLFDKSGETDPRSPAQVAAEEQLRDACKGKRRARKALLQWYDPVIVEIAGTLQNDRLHQFALVEAGRNGMNQALDLFDVHRDPAEFPGFARKIIERNMLLEWKHS